MSTPDDYVLDDDSTPVSLPQVAQPQQTTAPRKSGGANWLMLVLACGLAFFIAREIRDRDVIPTPDDDTVVIDENGNYALMLVDKSEQGQAKLNLDQSAAVNTIKVSKAAEEAGIEYTKRGIAEDLKPTDGIWGKLRAVAKEPPSLTISIDGKVKSIPIVDTKTTEKALKGAVK